MGLGRVKIGDRLLSNHQACLTYLLLAIRVMVAVLVASSSTDSSPSILVDGVKVKVVINSKHMEDMEACKVMAIRVISNNTHLKEGMVSLPRTGITLLLEPKAATNSPILDAYRKTNTPSSSHRRSNSSSLIKSDYQ